MTPQQTRTVKLIAPGIIMIFLLECALLWTGRLGGGLLAFLVFGIYALAVELAAVEQGGESTLSELTWLLWVEQPWVIWLVSALIAQTSGYLCARLFPEPYGRIALVSNLIGTVVLFLCGHFLGQSSDEYAAIRSRLMREARARRLELKKAETLAVRQGERV